MAATTDELRLNVTNFPENVIDVGKITFGEDQRKRKKLDKSSKEKLDSQNIKLTRAACALLNSGGGVIRAEIENEKYSFMRHRIGLDIEKSFRDCVQSDLFNDYFDVVQDGLYLDIWVKTWSSEMFSQPTVISKARLCCLETGLLWRSGTSAVQMKPLEALNFLKEKQASAKKDPGEVAGLMSKRARLSDGIWHSKEGGVHVEEDILKAAARFLERDSLKFEESLDFSESTEVELKELTRVGDILEFVKATLPKYLSAFANTKGGYLIYGVSDDGKVTGYKENLEPDQLEIEVQEATEILPHFHFCGSFKKVSTECKILPVYEENGTRHGYVFAVQVKPLCCAVFVAAPDSWIVKDRQVKKLRVDEWVELMTAEDPDLSHFNDGFQLELSRSCKSPLSKSVYSAKGVACLKDLRSSLCPGDSSGICYKPEELCTELFSEYEGLKNIMHKKMKELQLSKGVLMFSRSWAVDVGLQQNSWVACDVFLVATGTFPRLYTITVDEDCSVSSVISLLEYSTNVSHVLKQKLVNEGGYTQKLSVLSHVITLGISGEVKIDMSSQVTCPQPYLISSHEDLIQALAIVLLRFRSFLSDQLGCEFFNLLTIKQHEILTKNLHKNKKLFIYGLPGSGKTIVALQIIEKMKNAFCCDSEEILYICENRPLCETVRMENICNAVTRASFLKGKYPPFVKHIIIDEAQNFQSGDGDWYGEAVKITQADAHKPGILWIFLDYLQKTHSFSCGLPPPCDQQPQEWLTLGVRNATNIYDIMKKQMHSILSFRNELYIPYEQLKKLVEEARCGHSLAGVLVEPEVNNENTIADYIVNHCLQYFRNGYSGKNIAILCNTATERDKYRLLLESKMSRHVRKLKLSGGFSNADDPKGNSIVLDSVRRFSGLERSIVFSIYPLSVPVAIAANLLLCMVSRANLHCHLLCARVEDSVNSPGSSQI
ncbi:schlafen family member 11-like [Sphaerodactylus townsendi]|uniref:schlafen family member 11-like n=1 Tax=Sphaerodactylus townsendi TaxID=933632 RepID=UPI0020270E3A|nr:schlafen family member 11-like [Sphaerodactylus townsendi]XP_048375201.1 schlafen family member 11-like [Sphaerodactylus townsendi]